MKPEGSELIKEERRPALFLHRGRLKISGNPVLGSFLASKPQMVFMRIDSVVRIKSIPDDRASATGWLRSCDRSGSVPTPPGRRWFSKPSGSGRKLGR